MLLHKNKAYARLYLDPKWKKLSLAKRRAYPVCERCCTKPTAHVHHGYYCDGLKPWQYPASTLWSLCEPCHKKMDRLRKDGVKMLGGVHPADVETAIAMLGQLRRTRASNAATTPARMVPASP